MMDSSLNHVIAQLDGKKMAAPNGQPMWHGRDIMPILGYTNWVNFRNVIDKAAVACDNSGVFSSDHFVEFDDEIEAGKGAKVKAENVKLSKYACYLIAMNGDAAKPEIATAQTYFAVQTHRQESQDALTDEERRLLLRDRVKDGNKKLSSAASDAGVRSSMFGVFHDAGYKGLYGGKGLKEIKSVKGVDAKDDLLDRMSRAELAANEFRITQCEEILKKDAVKGEQEAIDTHYVVGKKVRDTIKEIGGTMPEQLPAEPSIKELAAAKAKEAKKLKASDNESSEG